MKLLKIIEQELKTTQELIQLPHYLVRTLIGYEQAGEIQFEEFIVNSTKNFIDSYSINTNGHVGKLNLDNTLTLSLRLPRILNLKLSWLTYKTKATKSEIIHEALGHSVPMLLDREEAQKDYMHELAQEER